jgi:predicted kinase
VKTAFSFAVTGSINSGKSTLARRLAETHGAVLLSSDDLRASLSHRQRRRGERVFAVMRQRLEVALARGHRIVLDSTGMSPRFRAMLHAYRQTFFHVHLRLESAECFEERERSRTDRPTAPVPRSAFHRSNRLEFYEPPDMTIATDRVTPEQVYEQVVASS